MTRLMAFLGLVASVFALFHWVHPIHRYDHGRDEFLLGGIGLLYLLIAAVMIGRTPRWSARGLGLLATMLGDAVLYGSGVWRLTDREHSWPGTPPPAAVTNDLVRALFVVGGFFLLYGLIRYVWPAEVGP